jgi:Tfp pilus assembly protein FimT
MSRSDAAREVLRKERRLHELSRDERDRLQTLTGEIARKAQLAREAAAQTGRATPEAVEAAERVLALAQGQEAMAQRWLVAALATRAHAQRVLDAALSVRELAEEDLYVARIIAEYEQELSDPPPEI